MKPIYKIDKCNYVTYNNPQDAEIVHEKFWLQKSLFGVVFYRKQFRQDSNIWEERALRKTGFNK